MIYFLFLSAVCAKQSYLKLDPYYLEAAETYYVNVKVLDLLSNLTNAVDFTITVGSSDPIVNIKGGVKSQVIKKGACLPTHNTTLSILTASTLSSII